MTDKKERADLRPLCVELHWRDSVGWRFAGGRLSASVPYDVYRKSDIDRRRLQNRRKHCCFDFECGVYTGNHLDDAA